jgi:hypothetical protein
MAPTSAIDYTLPGDDAPTVRAVMRFSREVADGGRGGRRPSGPGRRAGSDLMNRDFTAEIPGK